jgi:chromate reductase
MAVARRVLLVSGSTRLGSTNTAALRAAQATASRGIIATLYDDLACLPAFNPDDDHDPLPPQVAALRDLMAAADAVLFCSPEYAGSLPGSFKNLLDWVVGGGQLYEKPVAWVNVAPAGRGGGADGTLTVVLGYLGARIVTAACLHLPLSRDAIGADGVAIDPAIAAALRQAIHTLLSTSAATAG